MTAGDDEVDAWLQRPGPEEVETAVATLRQEGHAAAVIGDGRSGSGSIRIRPS
jgi:hypothetical protein